VKRGSGGERKKAPRGMSCHIIGIVQERGTGKPKGRVWEKKGEMRESIVETLSLKQFPGIHRGRETLTSA